MIKRFTSVALSFALIAGAGVPAWAAPCRDAKGKFIKCPPKPAPTVKRCRNGKGQFAKCGTPGAVSVK
jgi:hypothetical protein